MPTVTLPSGGRLHYRQHADGAHSAPLVLVHGAGGNHMHWPAELRRLPDAVVYSLDLPGHGKSDGPGQPNIGAYAEAVHTFVDALGLPRFVLVGHSMGGAIALEYALHYAPRLAAVTISTGGQLCVAGLSDLRTDFADHRTACRGHRQMSILAAAPVRAEASEVGPRCCMATLPRRALRPADRLHRVSVPALCCAGRPTT